jgi:hypothetical protein
MASFLIHHWLWISLPIMLIAALLLGFFIYGLVRLVRRKPILDLPLVSRQEVEFPEAGRVHLCREGPRLTIWKGQDYVLLAADGSRVKSFNLLFKSRVAGISRIRWEHLGYDLPLPGSYTLLVHGLETAPDQAGRHRLMFIKPTRALMAGYIVGITLSALMLIGSLVTFMLRLLQNTP